MMDGRKRQRKTLAQRFWSKVDKRGPNECWPWTGMLSPDGYGRLGRTSYSRQLRAPRVSWLLAHGEEASQFVCHKCDNPLCVNPAHLFLGTQKDNVDDMMAKGRHAAQQNPRTHCPRGHEYTPENTYFHSLNRYYCRACNRAAAARRKAERSIRRAA